MSDLTLEELRAKAKEGNAKASEKVKLAEAARERRHLEGEIKLAELDETLGVRGRDYAAVFSAKTGHMVVVRAPSEVAWQRAQARGIEGKLSLKDMLELVNTCLAYPGASEFGSITEITPAIVGQASDAISDLAGVRDKETAGK